MKRITKAISSLQIQVLTLLILVLSCTQHVPFTKPEVASNPLYSVTPLPVSLDPHLLALEESGNLLGHHIQLDVGKALQWGFKNTPSSSLALSLKDSQIAMKVLEGSELGPRFEGHYTLTVALVRQRRTEVITATATATSHISVDYAARWAVENAVYELHQKVKAF